MLAVEFGGGGGELGKEEKRERREHTIDRESARERESVRERERERDLVSFEEQGGGHDVVLSLGS